eukprot:gene18348-biopygen2403
MALPLQLIVAQIPVTFAVILERVMPLPCRAVVRQHLPAPVFPHEQGETAEDASGRVRFFNFYRTGRVRGRFFQPEERALLSKRSEAILTT